MSAPTIYLATPCHRGSPEALASIHDFGDKLITKMDLTGCHIGVVSNCPWLDCARADLLSEFLSGSWSHLLFRDDDIVFEPSLVIQMLMKKTAISLAAYRERLPPHKWAVHRDEQGKIQYAGLGVCLLSRAMLVRMTEFYAKELGYEQTDGTKRVGLFAHKFVTLDGKQRLLKEDHAFFYRASEIGYSIEEVTGNVVHGGIANNS